jgi:hypothetical protein
MCKFDFSQIIFTIIIGIAFTGTIVEEVDAGQCQGRPSSQQPRERRVGGTFLRPLDGKTNA